MHHIPIKNFLQSLESPKISTGTSVDVLPLVQKRNVKIFMAFILVLNVAWAKKWYKSCANVPAGSVLHSYKAETTTLVGNVATWSPAYEQNEINNYQWISRSCQSQHPSRSSSGSCALCNHWQIQAAVDACTVYVSSPAWALPWAAVVLNLARKHSAVVL